MKYENTKRISGNRIVAKVADANVKQAVFTAATAEHENESIPDYISQSRKHQFQPPNRSEPTQAQPGTREKLQVMTERYRSGQPLHNPGDKACIERRNGTRICFQRLVLKSQI